MLIAGDVGGGKTYFILTIIEALLRTNAELYVLDPKNADLANLSAIMPKVYYRKEGVTDCIDHFYEGIYLTEDGLTKIDVNMKGETVWLCLEQLSDLFQRDKSTISRHIKNIFDEGELVRASTVAKFATVQKEGNRQVERAIEYYNLDVVISVGYRVKSQRGVQFRIWATNILKEYLKKVLQWMTIVKKNWVEVDTSKNYWNGFVIFGHRKRCFIVRCWKSMQQA